MAEVRREAEQQLGAGGEALDRRVLPAIATVYRNRLNLRPSAEPVGHFVRVRRGVSKIAALRAPEFAALGRRVRAAQVVAACDGAVGRGRPLGAPLLREQAKERRGSRRPCRRRL